MGYETRLIIGHLSSDKNPSFLQIAEINLCKCAFHSTIIHETDRTIPISIYRGAKKHRKDMYEQQLYAIDPKKILDIMVKDNKKTKYRRYEAAIPMLKSLIHTFRAETLKCVLYGY